MGAHEALLVRSPPPPITLTLLSFPTQRLFLSLVIIWLKFCSCIVTFGGAAATDDSNALLKFKESLLSSSTNTTNEDVGKRLGLSSWNSNSNSTRPCSGNYANWVGVLCFDGNVWGLQLENMGLTGEIDIDSLLLLPNLRTLSFINNNLDGSFPEFKKLGSLKSLFLSSNQFSGQIPDDAFSGMIYLKKLYLSNNELRGTIPTSLAQLPKLLDLGLEGNHFVGCIPNFNQDNHLKLLNVSNNQLEGPIPASIAHLSPSSFAGNKGLCGKPLDSVCKFPVGVDNQPPNAFNASSDAPLLSNHDQEFSMIKAILIIVSCGVVLGVIILVVMIIYHHRKNQTPQLGRAGSSISYNHHKKIFTGHITTASSHSHQIIRKKYEEEEEGESPQPDMSISTNTYGKKFNNKQASHHYQQQGHGKLSFIREDRQKFDLQDLLRASAEVLGSGNFGSSYKAVLMEGKSVVVKRFKQMNNIDRQEFNEHMTRLGRLIHPNLLPLVAYYFRKEEKLLVCDYVHNGSLASLLHGKRRVDQRLPGGVLDWSIRLKIVKGVARGMAYLYKELPSLIVSHGQLKSSNILLDESFNPLLMDYSLVPVVNQEHARKIMVAYRSPEYIQHGELTKKTDVWSLGILILEVLTGKFPPPPNYQLTTAKGPAAMGADLVSWVDSIVKEAEALQVFDKELLLMAVENNNNNKTSTSCSEGEMLKLFQIGMACCEEDVDKRLDLEEAVNKIEELKERDRPNNVHNHNYNPNSNLY